MKTQKKSVKSKVAICKSIASDRDGAKKKSRKIKVAIASIAASTALLLGGGFALSTAIKAKQDYKEDVKINFVDSVRSEIYGNLISQTKVAVESYKAESLNRDLTDIEKNLTQKYDEEYFKKYYEFLESNPTPQQLLDYLFDGFGEYENSVFLNTNEKNNDNKLTRDYFLGLTVSSSQCKSIFEGILKQLGYVGQAVEDFGQNIIDVWNSGNVVEIGKLIVRLADACAFIAGVIAGAIAICSVIPIVGWIAIGIIAAVSIEATVKICICGYLNKDFRLGVEVNTGFLGIPTGVALICG